MPAQPHLVIEIYLPWLGDNLDKMVNRGSVQPHGFVRREIADPDSTHETGFDSDPCAPASRAPERRRAARFPILLNVRSTRASER